MSKAYFRNVLDNSPEELRAAFEKNGLPGFRADQVLGWVYQKGVYDFAKMKNLGAETIAKVKEHFDIRMPAIVERQRSGQDKSTKLLIKLGNGDLVEAVYMSATKRRRIRPHGAGGLWTDSPTPCGEPVKDRETVCISSQVGCKFHCAFCASGQNGFFRNLTSGEIIAQVLLARDVSPKKSLTNIVFMGIGEPLDNYDSVLKAIRTLNSPKALGFGARRITVSTCGVVPKIERMAEEGLQIELSISLHGPNDGVRGAIMPVNQAYPIKPLMEAAKHYASKTGRAITFEYILIKGVNASETEARGLAKLLKGMLCKVNLIPYNPIEEFPHATPTYEEVLRFQAVLENAGIRTTVRFSKGQDIQAACGQLRSVKIMGERVRE